MAYPPHQPDNDDRTFSGRRFVRHKTLEPLSEEKRYVRVHQSHVDVFGGLFGWAMRQNRGRGKRKTPRLTKGKQGSAGPLPLAQQEQKKFSSYFEFGAGKALGSKNSMRDSDPMVHRNRIIFLVVVLGLILYSLFWVLN